MINGVNYLQSMKSDKTLARKAGLYYLLFISLFILSSVLRNQIVIAGDSASTLSNILEQGRVFQVSIVFELLALLFFFMAAWMLYVLLKQVENEKALLFLLLNAIGVAIECVSSLSMIGISTLGPALPTYTEAQRQELVTFFLKLYQNGFMIAQLFFSTWLLPLGYLIYESRFLPKALGVLIMMDFLFWLLFVLQFFLLPDFKVITYVSFPIAFVAEFSLTLWLLIKGIKDVEV